MAIVIRSLSGAKDFNEAIELQSKVGGLPPRDTMSPVTMSALSLKSPKIGWLIGAFDNDIMIGFSISFATAQQGVAFGHMLGVLPDYQNSGAGNQLLQFTFSEYRRQGIDKVLFTFEPLESRNCHLYLNKFGGQAVSYLEDHYHLDSGLHHGMPQDRFLCEVNMKPGNKSKAASSLLLEEALKHYPVATEANSPESEEILIEIPADVRALQAEEEKLALAWRLKTRPLFIEYINRRNMKASLLLSDLVDNTRRSYLLLCKTK